MKQCIIIFLLALAFNSKGQTAQVLTDATNITWNCNSGYHAEITFTTAVGNNHTLNISNDSVGSVGYLYIKQPTGHNYNIKIATGDIVSGGDGTVTIDLPNVDEGKCVIAFYHHKSTWRIWTVSKNLQ